MNLFSIAGTVSCPSSSVCQLRSFTTKLGGEANQITVRKMIDKMVQDGSIEDEGSQRLGEKLVQFEPF